MSGEAKHLILARHGRADHNELKYFLNEDLIDHVPRELLEREAERQPLTDLGKMQAQALGEWVSKQLIDEEGILPDHYYVSPLPRAEQTAGYVGLAIEADHPNTDVRWVRDRNLREQQRGDLELSAKLPGVTVERPPAVMPTSWMYRRFDGGESPSEAIERWHNYRHRRVDELAGNTALIILHGALMGAIELAIEGAGLSDDEAEQLFRLQKPANCNVVHYSSVEPETGEIADRLRWVRALVPYETDDGYSFDWREIDTAAKASSAELIKSNEKYESLIPDLSLLGKR